MIERRARMSMPVLREELQLAATVGWEQRALEVK